LKIIKIEFGAKKYNKALPEALYKIPETSFLKKFL
jgi:hypothetical protein